MKSLFVHKRWYLFLLAIVITFLASYLLQFLLVVGIIALSVLIIMSIIDIVLLYRKKSPLNIRRQVNSVFHLGEFNSVELLINNNTPINFKLQLIDEVPLIFQVRNFNIDKELAGHESVTLKYDIKAIKRGVFNFHDTIVFISSPLGLLQRKIIHSKWDEVKVYPSTKLFKKFQILAVTSQFALQGNRKLTKLGNSLEFDQIKEYTIGDDIRSVNWKATARKGNLMVNNYIDEKSQEIYNVIDGGRLMQYTFDGLTLLDYAVNASLLLSKLILLKDDKVGLIQYNDRVKHLIVADKKQGQLQRINQCLYNYQTDFKESALEYVLSTVNTKITQRSLLILYTNFESKISFDRQFPYLKQLAKKHLLMVVFFENDEIQQTANQFNSNVEDVFISTIAEKYLFEKKQIIKQMQNAGIIGVMTKPQLLQTEVVNQYLQLKSRQMI